MRLFLVGGSNIFCRKASSRNFNFHDNMLGFFDQGCFPRLTHFPPPLHQSLISLSQFYQSRYVTTVAKSYTVLQMKTFFFKNQN